MMQHAKEEQISAFIDNQLDAGESLELEAHVRDCADCRSLLEEMREVTRLFREGERVAPSLFLWNRIAAGIHEEKIITRSWSAAVLDGLRGNRRSLGVAAAALTIFLAAGVTVFHYSARQAAEQAALAAIDQTQSNLAAHDPDLYNPFSAGSLGDLDPNPFRTLRLSIKTAQGD